MDTSIDLTDQRMRQEIVKYTVDLGINKIYVDDIYQAYLYFVEIKSYPVYVHIGRYRFFYEKG